MNNSMINTREIAGTVSRVELLDKKQERHNTKRNIAEGGDGVSGGAVFADNKLAKPSQR
jgi:hypothetical protein